MAATGEPYSVAARDLDDTPAARAGWRLAAQQHAARSSAAEAVPAAGAQQTEPSALSRTPESDLTT
jgi:hypothetical protein